MHDMESIYKIMISKKEADRTCFLPSPDVYV